MDAHANRRDFLRDVGLAGLGLAASSATVGAFAAPAETQPTKLKEPLVVAIIGTGDRGKALARTFAGLAGSEVKYVCDVDLSRARAAAVVVAGRQARETEAVQDLHRVLEDRSVAAVAIATPDHWHAPAAILACAAGKHVYVEKPCCHNPGEGELLVQAARKYRRIVQHGTQRRSSPKVIEAIQRVRAGEIGRVVLSRGWYTNERVATGQRTPASPPHDFDWDLWQGPAPRRAFTENVVPYKWHWYWHWGTGEMGNNGVHSLDLCRWGLGVDYPHKVTAGGGRFQFRDDQETPDTLNVTYDFGDKAIFWEGRSCLPRGLEGSTFGVAFYGDRASLVIDSDAYRIFNMKDELIDKHDSPIDDAAHAQNFLDCIQSGARPSAEIEEGYKSALLCHLGNIAYRCGGAIQCDPTSGRLIENPAALKLWNRQYEAGWEPKI